MNTGTTEEIRKALEQITAGEWWHFQTNDSIVCDATEPIHMRKAIADILSCNHADTKLIANAPAWLRSLLEENRKQQQYIHQLRGALGYAVPGDIQDDPDIVNGIAESLSQQLEQMKEERDAWHERADTLFGDKVDLDGELAAKDKVLESIKNAPAYTSRTWMREQASSILSQYAINESKPDPARADSVGTKDKTKEEQR